MRNLAAIYLAGLAYLAPPVLAQVSPAEIETTSFNSSFTLSKAQIEIANITESTAKSIENVVNFDRSQLAWGGPHQDDFYTLPALTNKTGPLKPGQLLKVQEITNVSAFSTPPNTALSRILYTTVNTNGTVIPTSAFILWPFRPRQFKSSNGRAPVVLWNHGTSGFFPNAAPSAHRALWYGHEAPFALTLAGYAVVAPDYAGIGISKSWDGSSIPHNYLMSPASAVDGLYGLRAALEAFSATLSTEWVTMGHSQGGGVTWAVAEALESKKDEFSDLLGGYKGAIAGSPTTDLYTGLPQFILPWVGMALDSIFPDFKLEEWLTPLGIARTKLLQEIEGGIGVGQQIYLTGEAITKDTYNATWHAQAYADLANAGRKPFKGPLLVIQGTKDAYIPYNTTAATVQGTCALDSHNDLEFLTIQGTQHVPSLDATRWLWLDWIQSRFEGKEVEKKGCVDSNLESFLPIEQYQATGNSILQWAGAPEYIYQVPLGL